jgi:hypothetical protein
VKVPRVQKVPTVLKVQVLEVRRVLVLGVLRVLVLGVPRVLAAKARPVSELPIVRNVLRSSSTFGTLGTSSTSTFSTLGPVCTAGTFSRASTFSTVGTFCTLGTFSRTVGPLAPSTAACS